MMALDRTEFYAKPPEKKLSLTFSAPDADASSSIPPTHPDSTWDRLHCTAGSVRRTVLSVLVVPNIVS